MWNFWYIGDEFYFEEVGLMHVLCGGGDDGMGGDGGGE